MVAQRSPEAQRQVNADHAVGQNDRVRCIDARMGSKLQRHQHGWSVVGRGEPTAHQLSRAVSSFLSMKTFASDSQNQAILLRINVTAVAFVNRMGGTHSVLLSDLAVQIWRWCLERNIVIHAEHLPGRENVRTDWHS